MFSKMVWTATAWILGPLLLAGPARAAPPNKRICVEVVLQEVAQEPEQPKEEPAVGEQTEDQAPQKKSKKYPWERFKPGTLQATTSAHPYLPIGQTPVVYLKRLFEHFITHEKGYEAVQEKCDERIRVELYPLAEGWTAFARYSANGREERADQLFANEISQFAERAVHALLLDVPISDTIKRDNVLKSDSMKSVQRIKGTNHFVIGLGTQLRGGQFFTANSSLPDGKEEKLRLFTPMTISTGYRGKFENWGIETMLQGSIGTSDTAAIANPEGGHIDFKGSVGLMLHFLHYLNPRGITSAYLGAGADFELLFFSAIKATEDRNSNDRSMLLGGGLDVDLIFGWEFMRASAVQFYLQAELNLPAYVIDNEDNHGGIHTWFPTASVKLGVIF